MFLVLLAGAATAQVPGYLGKRFAIFLDGNVAPAMFVQNENNALMSRFLYAESKVMGGDELGIEERPYKKGVAFNYRPQVTLEYLVGHRLSVGVSYSRLQMGTTRAYQTGEEIQETEYKLDPDVVKGMAGGLHIKLYLDSRSGAVAPLGFYHVFSCYLTQTNTYNDKHSKTKQFRDDFKYPVVTYGWGKQTMFARNFLVKTGVEIGYAFVPGNYLKEGPGEWNVQEYSGYNVHGSLLGYYLVNVSIAVGYLPF
jgi:hypothetical protein